MESNPIDRMTPDLPEGWLKALKKPETVKQ
jgi:hypothetical protein